MAEGHNLEGHTPEGVPTDRNLTDVSNNIGNGWESLAACLNVSYITVEQIKADHKQLQQQIYNMLLKWRSTEGCNGTMTSLFEKMYNATGVSIDWNKLQEMFRPVIDNVCQMRRDYGQQVRTPVSMDINQIGHNPACLIDRPQVPLKVLQNDLLAYYRKWFSRCTLSPMVDEDEYAVNFLEIYVKPNITIPSQQGSIRQFQSIPVKSCHDIFKKDSKPYRNIFLSSPAGCGKTSFARWLALTWCQAHQPIVADNKWFIAEDVDEMRTFTLLFIIFLCNEHEQECDVDIMIQNQLLPKLGNSTTYTELGLKYLQMILCNVKCIIILDGLDEWNHPHGNQCNLHNKQQTPYIRARPLCTTMTTSRPWKLDVVGLQPGEIDQKLELNGLEEDLLKCLIGNVFTKMNKLRGKQMQAYDFKKELRDKNLTALSKIPVVLMQLLTVWFDDEPLGESQCEIYSNMIEFLLKRYWKKRKIVSEKEDIEVDDCSRDRQTPKCLQRNTYCKVHMELLSKLATLAYNTLFTDNKESSLVFDRKIAQKYLTDPEIEMSLAVGILTQEKVIGNFSKRQSHISFIYKTFQEYFAALHVALSKGMVTNVVEKIKRVCYSIEKIVEMSQIFMFLCGLCPEVMENLQEHLRQTVSEDSRTQRYRASCELHPFGSSEGSTLRQVQDIMVEWLGECWLNGYKHVTHLPVSDFFIWSTSQWSDVLKILAFHNPVCSLYVRDVASPEEIEDIQSSVTVFTSVKKLWLYMVSETFVVQLVSQHKHSLRVRPETWRHLECVTLTWMAMSGDILCSLVDSILQLPKSVHVRLERCITRQGTRDWKAYIRSHPRLTVDVDEDDDLLQFHTNKV